MDSLKQYLVRFHRTLIGMLFKRTAKWCIHLNAEWLWPTDLISLFHMYSIEPSLVCVHRAPVFYLCSLMYVCLYHITQFFPQQGRQRGPARPPMPDSSTLPFLCLQRRNFNWAVALRNERREMSSVWVLTDRYLCARVCVNVTFFADLQVMMSFTGGIEPCKVRGEMFSHFFFLFSFWFRFSGL